MSGTDAPVLWLPDWLGELASIFDLLLASKVSKENRQFWKNLSPLRIRPFFSILFFFNLYYNYW